MAHSSVYDCHCPSGNTPSGWNLATGMLGGAVCCSFGPAWQTQVQQIRHHKQLCRS